MPKNIVVCCDGTGNQYGYANSNVVKLYWTLPAQEKQIAYYHPGVGTMGARNALSALGKWWTRVRGLAFGYGFSDNIADVYSFLMKEFEPDAQIFIFGFSRGAYTARALCGLLQMCGLLTPGNEALIPYALRLYKSNDACKFEIAAGFKNTFSIPCTPYFLGLWDTVSSVGWILDPVHTKGGHLPYTATLPGIPVIRHAISIDERRAFFRQNLIHQPAYANQNFKEVWFAGVHSDVGGSYAEAESGQSRRLPCGGCCARRNPPGCRWIRRKSLTCWAERFPTFRRTRRGSCINRYTDSGGWEKSGRNVIIIPFRCRGKPGLSGSRVSPLTWGARGGFQRASISTRVFLSGCAR